MTHEIIVPSFQRRDARGLFQEVLNTGSWQSVISGAMNAGAVLGQHYHRHTEVFFFLFSGSVSIRTVHVETGAWEQFTLQANQGVLLRTWESHAITFSEPGEFLLLKSRRYDAADPDTYAWPVPEAPPA
jgi:dTDP-4-dehydrorhamnose 3,5-epimerase-like enzyme